MNLFRTISIATISLKKRKLTLFFLGGVTLLLFMILTIINKPLINRTTPNGIISFELAKTFSNSEIILTSWEQTEKQYAALSLGLDYLFMFAYSLFLCLSILIISDSFKNRNHFLFLSGFYLAWLQLLAAIFDGFENYFLIKLLFGSQLELFSQLAFYFASIKFF